MAWYYPAIASALCWGLYYPIADLLLKRFSGPFLLICTHLLSAIVFSCVFQSSVKDDVREILASSRHDFIWLLALAVLCICANYVSFMAISMKNATLAALIEISYPLFAAIFAFALFKQVNFNSSTVIGGILIILGTLVVAKG